MNQNLKWIVFLILQTIITQEVLAQNQKTCSEAPPDACGENASCHDKYNPFNYVYEGSYCKCNEGFIGTPPNCTEGCNSDFQCFDDEFCNPAINKCEIGCRPGSCSRNNYCDSSTRKCTKGCEFDQACRDGLFCDLKTHQCAPGCRSRFSNGECSSLEYCNTELHDCQKICTDSACGPNSECRVKNGQKVCFCQPGFTPQRGKGCQKVESTEASCQNACAREAECKIHKMNVTTCSCMNGSELDNPFMRCTPGPNIGNIGGYASGGYSSEKTRPADLSSVQLCTVMACSG